MKTFLSLLLFASTAASQVRINLIHVEGTGSASVEFLEQVFQETKQVFWDEMRWKLKLETLKTTQDIYPELDGLALRSDRYRIWGTDWLRHNEPLNSKQIWYVALPPIHEGEQKYIAGQASAICSRTKFLRSAAVGNADEGRGINRNRAVMIHELAHVFGASHDDVDANYMHPNAIAYAEQPLRFKSRAKREMLKCQRKTAKFFERNNF